MATRDRPARNDDDTSRIRTSSCRGQRTPSAGARERVEPEIAWLAGIGYREPDSWRSSATAALRFRTSLRTNTGESGGTETHRPFGNTHPRSRFRYGTVFSGSRSCGPVPATTFNLRIRSTDMTRFIRNGSPTTSEIPHQTAHHRKPWQLPWDVFQQFVLLGDDKTTIEIELLNETTDGTTTSSRLQFHRRDGQDSRSKHSNRAKMTIGVDDDRAYPIN